MTEDKDIKAINIVKVQEQLKTKFENLLNSKNDNAKAKKLVEFNQKFRDPEFLEKTRLEPLNKFNGSVAALFGTFEKSISAINAAIVKKNPFKSPKNREDEIGKKKEFIKTYCEEMK